MNCAICNIRKPRRYCPGVRGEICTICCGTEREQTVDCPLDCQYLHEAHQHEKPVPVDPKSVPNGDIRVTQEFLEANEVLLAFVAAALVEGSSRFSSATDWDIREALDALIRTYRTRESGIYYETRPANAYAAGIAEHVENKIAEIREKETRTTGLTTIRDASVLGVLVFIQRLEYANNNGRKRSRAFLDFLRHFYVPPEPSHELSPEREDPRIIL